jgi:orotidine-5'-phosphate decarboxylase
MAPLPFQQRFRGVAARRSPLCVGVDPSAESLRGWGLADDVRGLGIFCERLVAVAASLVAVMKPQAAFFERQGPEGMAVLRDTVAAIQRRGALAIIDAKCGDIGSTAVAYGDAYLGPDSPYRGDAMTASPYLGLAALEPIFAIARRSGAGVFVVVRSSNPEGAGLQQAVMADGRSVAARLADAITSENGDELGPIGAVVGATLGAEAGALAAQMSNALILVPGIGAQGATIADVRRDFGPHFERVIPSVSRGIARAGPDPDALRQAVERYTDELRSAPSGESR